MSERLEIWLSDDDYSELKYDLADCSDAQVVLDTLEKHGIAIGNSRFEAERDERIAELERASLFKHNLFVEEQDRADVLQEQLDEKIQHATNVLSHHMMRHQGTRIVCDCGWHCPRPGGPHLLSGEAVWHLRDALLVPVSPSTEITHQSPPVGEGLTPCCGRTPFELPRTDRMTNDPELVTCWASDEPSAAADLRGFLDEDGPHRFGLESRGAAVPSTEQEAPTDG